MPIQYSPFPEIQLPNMNLLGAYAQGQALASNRLRDQVLQNELAQQEALRGVITQPNFDLNSPAAVQQLTQAGALGEALKLRASQEEGRVRKAQESNLLNEILIRGKRFEAELPNIKAMTKEHLAQANSAELKLFSDSTSVAQDIISRTSPETWSRDRAYISKIDPTLQPPEEFNEGWNDRALRTAKLMQDVATDITKKRMEAQIPKVVAPTDSMPGMVVGPRGVEKLPQVAQGSTAWGPEVAAPVVRGLREAVLAHELPRAPLDAIIDAHSLDCEQTPFADMAAFEAYCRDTHGSLMRLVVRVLGAGDRADMACDHAGLAFGAASQLRSFNYWWRHRRLRLPLNLFLAAGLGQEDVFAGHAKAALASGLGCVQKRIVLALQDLNGTRFPRAAMPALALATVARDVLARGFDLQSPPEPSPLGRVTRIALANFLWRV